MSSIYILFNIIMNKYGEKSILYFIFFFFFDKLERVQTIVLITS